MKRIAFILCCLFLVSACNPEASKTKKNPSENPKKPTPTTTPVPPAPAPAPAPDVPGTKPGSGGVPDTLGSKINMTFVVPDIVQSLEDVNIDIYIESENDKVAYLSSAEMIINYNKDNFAIVGWDQVGDQWLAVNAFGSWNGGHPDPEGVNDSIDDGQFWISFLSMPPAQSITKRIKIGTLRFKSITSEPHPFELSTTVQIGEFCYTRFIGGNFDLVTGDIKFVNSLN